MIEGSDGRERQKVSKREEKEEENLGTKNARGSYTK